MLKLRKLRFNSTTAKNNQIRLKKLSPNNRIRELLDKSALYCMSHYLTYSKSSFYFLSGEF